MSEKQEPSKLFDSLIPKLIVVCVVAATVIIPLGLWVANRFFDWQPPAFLQSAFDFFKA